MKVIGKVLKFGFIVVVLFFISFFLYKGYLVYVKYRVTNFQYSPVQGNVDIKTSRECDLDFGDFSICLPEQFSMDTNKTYVKNGISYFDLETHVVISTVLDNDLEKNIQQILESDDVDDNFSSVLEEYQIHNLVDVLHYLDQHADDSITVFTPVSDIRMSYLSKVLFDMSFPSGDISYLTGNHYGYLIKQSRNYYSYLYHDDKIYEITFLNSPSDTDYFTDDIVYDILSSVHFKMNY